LRRPAQWRGRRFVVVREELDVRAQDLGVLGQIDIHLTRYTNARGTVASIRALEGGDWRIVLDTTLSPALASESIYHELAHVLQAQRLGGFDRLEDLCNAQWQEIVSAAAARRWRLRTPHPSECSIEIEADELAALWNDQSAIARERISR
jgi:hypothetical protein